MPTDEIHYREDITCPKTAETIPMDKYSYSKFSDTLSLVYCPNCNVWHQFEVAKGS